MSLPPDLLYATTEQLVHDIPTLKALSLTCKGLSDYCQRRIFSTITANIVVGGGVWERGVYGQVNLDALLAVIKDNRRLGSYVKHLFLSLECCSRFIYSVRMQEEWLNHHLPQFCQTYICPLLVNLTELEILRLHSDLPLTEDADLNQTIGIFQAISSPFLSHISICNLALALPAAAATHLSKLELLSSPLLRILQKAEHRPTPIKLESFGYLIEDSFDSTIFSGSSHTLEAIKDGKTLDFTGLRSFQFGSRHDQDHYGAAQILAAAATQLEELIYVFPPGVSGGAEHISIQRNLLHPERRTLFERAKALRNVTFRISAGDIHEDLGYSGIDFPRIFTWTIQSLTVLSQCPQLEEIRFEILDASEPLFARLSDDWRRLDVLLVSGTDIPASLKRVSICIEITRYKTSEEEKLRLRKEWGDLAKDLFKETHDKTGIVVSPVIWMFYSYK